MLNASTLISVQAIITSVHTHVHVQGRSQDFMNGGAQLGAAKLLATPTN